MEYKAGAVDAPDAFLEALGKRLTETEGVDDALAEILKGHILKAASASNAVVQAKDAILRLAAERANPSKPKVVNG